MESLFAVRSRGAERPLNRQRTQPSCRPTRNLGPPNSIADSSASARRAIPSNEHSERNGFPGVTAFASRSSDQCPPRDPHAQGPPEFQSLSRKRATKDESIGIYVGPAVRRSREPCMRVKRCRCPRPAHPRL